MTTHSLVALSRSAVLKDFEAQLYGLLEKVGSKVLEIKTLTVTGSAVEYVVSTISPVLKEELYELSSRTKIDIVVQENTPSRRKKLVVFDMDSTLIQQEVIDMIAAYAGVEDQVSKVTEAAMRGELDFAQSLEERVKLLKGVPITVYDDIKKDLKFTTGAQELCTVLKQRGVKLAVLSGGFQPFVNWAKETLGLDYAFANHLEDDGENLTGKTTGRIVDAQVKADLLAEIADKNGIDLEDVLAVGDGSNDLKMMAKAGFGVAFSAKPIVQKQAPSRLNTGNLADILYILGY